MASDIKKRFADTDPAMKIVIGTDNSKVETMLAESKAMNAMSVETSDSLIKCILACPNGPLAYHLTEDGKKIIQTSSNLAIIKTEGGKVSLRTLSRSSVKSELENTVEDIKKTFKRFCGESQFTNHSSALCWEPDWNSDFLKIAKEVFRKQEGYNPEVYAPHCYMEGAYFVKIHKVLPIAIGPQIDGAHTVGEKVLIPTVNKCYNIVKSIISSLTVR